MLLRSRHKTEYRQPGFLTPVPYMVFEPPRHSPFFIAPAGRVCDGTDPCGCVTASHTAFSEAKQGLSGHLILKNRLLRDYFLKRIVMHNRIAQLYCNYSNFRMSVAQCHPAGLCQLYVFMLSIIRSSKFIRSELMNTQGRGILSHLSEKISRLRFPAVAQLVFFPASAEHPSFPCVQVCQRANKLQTAIIRIKKNIAL